MAKAAHITPTAKQLEYYADMADDLLKHPVTGDIVRVTNEVAVASSIRHILLTDRGEWPFRPDLGSDIRKALFQPFGPFMKEDLTKAVSEAIRRFEPRALLAGIDIFEAQSDGGIGVNIAYQTINDPNMYKLTVILTRAR